jgi:hypothetical protein
MVQSQQRHKTEVPFIVRIRELSSTGQVNASSTFLRTAFSVVGGTAPSAGPSTDLHVQHYSSFRMGCDLRLHEPCSFPQMVGRVSVSLSKYARTSVAQESRCAALDGSESVSRSISCRMPSASDLLVPTSVKTRHHFSHFPS